ncbi:hypothetical protein MCOR27_003755 [Pyricularia oryzae]|nr:hypothetical protein MCOR01_007539 [Pyricularia oryzae]KAI6253163.1 hypothetical protein MCOR19_010252 [Pyricularia oryzae]KAI6282352.1 hypothetical protein MCOR27_003755 [Pyricularia oryzae]KAI6314589.1 hypothetical protein MCOR34_004876 [Pyricularia oryzae]KAI6347651.1 hypothetical protein MCOR30_000283 [Pyricularia oryzae]
MADSARSRTMQSKQTLMVMVIDDDLDRGKQPRAYLRGGNAAREGLTGKEKRGESSLRDWKGLYRSKYKDGEIFALSRRLCHPSPPSSQPASSFSRNLVNMHFSSLLLGLAATASAIDIRGHALDSCNGSYRACTNINPRVCCIFSESASSGRVSVDVVAIPTNWRISAQSWTGGACRFIGTLGSSGGSRSICLPYTNRGDRTGGHYWFNSLKRSVDDSCPAEQPGGGKCDAGVQPDVIGLADGTEYSIAGLSADKIEEIEKIADSGAGAEAMPAEFQVLRRSIEA